MNEKERKAFADKLQNGEAVDAEVRSAVKRALKSHKEKQNPVAVWDGDQVRILTPDEIPAEG